MSSPKVVNIDQDGGRLSLVAQFIRELEQFVQSRSKLFTLEIRQKLPHLLNAAQLGLASGLLLVTGYLFLAIVVLIGAAFPQNPYGWFFGFLIVGTISLGFGAIAAFLAKSEVDSTSIVPQRTLNVLKQDQDWIMGVSHPQK